MAPRKHPVHLTNLLVVACCVTRRAGHLTPRDHKEHEIEIPPFFQRQNLTHGLPQWQSSISRSKSSAAPPDVAPWPLRPIGPPIGCTMSGSIVRMTSPTSRSEERRIGKE